MIDYAIELGHEVIAFTEHETVANAIKIEKYYTQIKKEHPNFKVILGNEIYLCRDGLNAENFDRANDKYFHFVLLARNSEGHQQIRELSTRAWMRSYVTGKMRRVPTYYQDLIDIIGKNPGNVIASTACLGGFLGTKLLQYRQLGAPADFMLRIESWLIQMQSIFGKENFYLEMQPSNNSEQIYVNKQILALSEKLNLPYIITTDSHYLKKEDAPIHKAFLNSQDGDREVDSFYETTYLMGTDELESFFPYFSEIQLTTAYQNIKKIKDSCEDFSLLKDLKIPSLNWGKTPHYPKEAMLTWSTRIPWLKKFANSDFMGDRVMANLVIDKLEKDTRLQSQESYDELNENLKMTWISSEVNKAHWSAYFLNLRGILDTCWEAGSLVGPGRGSGVGFYLLYILDLIQINPLWETTNTYSWRLTDRFKGPLCLATSLK